MFGKADSLKNFLSSIVFSIESKKVVFFCAIISILVFRFCRLFTVIRLFGLDDLKKI